MTGTVSRKPADVHEDVGTEAAVREETGLVETGDGLSLELKIFKQVLGEISTNADQVLAAATKKSAEYHDIQRFKGREDLAKKERADVNRAIKSIDDGKKRLKEWWMKPLDDTFSKIDLAKATLKTASVDLDQCVKTVEWEEAQEKKADIQAYFDSKKFDLVPMDRIFNDRWLNKGFKMADVKKEVDARTAEIYQNIEILERIGEHGLTAKALYLQTLDIGAAMRQVDELKANAERLAREQAERENRKAREQVEENRRDLEKEEQAVSRNERIDDLTRQALDLPESELPSEPEKPSLFAYTLSFKGTEQQLLELRQYMASKGIPYQKAMVFNTDDEADLFMRRKNIAGVIYSLVYVA
jgi:hypothetical protein